MKLFDWTNGPGGEVVKRYFLSSLSFGSSFAPCSGKYLCKFGRGHHEEHFCDFFELGDAI